MCRECTTTSPRWVGRCPGCGAWNTLEQENIGQEATYIGATALSDVALLDDAHISSGVGELDRVLGGGFLRGSTTLLYGEPGVGKSTLALLALRETSAREHTVLLICAEESSTQVARRARRMGEIPEQLRVCATTDVSNAVHLLRTMRPTLCVIDSISAMSDASLNNVAGSVSQVRSCAELLCGVAKEVGTALILVGHVTKEGELAGPRTLEHLVDTVLRIEGDRYATLRIVRALKHRFGPTGEMGLLEMVHEGMRDIGDSWADVRGPALDVPGVVRGVTNDGSRSIPVEIQALVASSNGAPRRVAHQLSAQRLSLLIAVLESRCGIDASSSDVFAASAGGLPANEPGVDLALALAVASSTLGFVVERDVACVGEVGLAGELRAVPVLGRRIREAQRLGARRVIVPHDGDLEGFTDVQTIRCRSLNEALESVKRHESAKVR